MWSLYIALGEYLDNGIQKPQETELIRFHFQTTPPLEFNPPRKRIRVSDDDHVVCELHDFIPLFRFCPARQDEQRLVRALKQFLLIFPPQRIVARPVDDLLVYALQRALPVHLVLDRRGGGVERGAEAQAALVDEALDGLGFLRFVDLGDAHVCLRGVGQAAFEVGVDRRRGELGG
jgi:hypothetical protein